MVSYEENLRMVQTLAQRVSAAGGTVYYVGGYVRDLLRGVLSKDLDVEVHGIAPETLADILDSLGERISMGESFGIFGLRHYAVDIAMPRKEKLIGRGHKDFEVFVDPFIGTEKAAMRRDFTINAMMQNVLTGEIIDHFHGEADLKAGVLRHVNNETFVEDPLRVLRAAQFAARFGFTLAPETLSVCRTVSLDALSKERVAGELFKALDKAGRPSVFFETLRDCGQLDFWFPEIKALTGVPVGDCGQADNSVCDVYAHTMQTLDAAAGYRLQVHEPRYFMLAALMHDLGKAVCFQKGSPYDAHAEEGARAAKNLLNRLTDEKKAAVYVDNMVRLHMLPKTLSDAPPQEIYALYDRSVSVEDLIRLRQADDLAGPSPQDAQKTADLLFCTLEEYQRLALRPEVTGQDLLAAGLRPGKTFSVLLQYAHKLHLCGDDKEEAMAKVLEKARLSSTEET